MFNTVKKWVDENPHRSSLNHTLSSASVKAGANHKGGNPNMPHSHSHSGADNSHSGFGGYGQAASKVWDKIQARDLGAMREIDSPTRGVSPAPLTPAGLFGYSYAPGASAYGGGGGGGEPYLGAHSGPSSYQAPGGGGYQAQDQYQGGGSGGYGGGYGGPPQQSYGGGPGGYGGPPQQTGWDQRPQSQGGWQQGPPPPQQ
ncbi:hypothetical protein V496_07022, partial [Pseudogymnoascus sp. VKM F-4515 (FW-2607)]